MVRFVVMAAGQATRMGRDKLALPWQATTVLGKVIETVLEVIKEQETVKGISAELSVVARKPIEEYLPEKLKASFCFLNGTWRHVNTIQPLSETIQLGLENLSKSIKGICFIPGDQVGITVRELRALLYTFNLQNPDFLVPTDGNITGAPVFFNKNYVSDLLNLEGEQGGKIILYKYRELWTLYPVMTDFFDDIDTFDQYLKYLEKH